MKLFFRGWNRLSVISVHDILFIRKERSKAGPTAAASGELGERHVLCEYVRDMGRLKRMKWKDRKGRLKLNLLTLSNTGFETASLPTTSDALKKQLLNFAIVGGGRKFHSLLPSSLSRPLLHDPLTTA